VQLVISDQADYKDQQGPLALVQLEQQVMLAQWDMWAAKATSATLGLSVTQEVKATLDPRDMQAAWALQAVLALQAAWAMLVALAVLAMWDQLVLPGQLALAQLVQLAMQVQLV